MSSSRHWTRVTRVVLVVAALLYSVGAFAEPLVHVGEWTDAAAHETERPGTPDQAPGDDLCCFICKSLATVAELGTRAALPDLTTRATSAPLTSDPHPSVLRHNSAQPRGPPLA